MSQPEVRSWPLHHRHSRQGPLSLWLRLHHNESVLSNAAERLERLISRKDSGERASLLCWCPRQLLIAVQP
jgi:hypothetical protein